MGLIVSDEDLATAQDEALVFAARRVWRRYRSYVSFEDMEQEARVWVHTHPHKVADIFRDAEDHKALSNRLKRFGNIIERQLERTARSAKAAKVGYHPDDEFFYGKAVLDEVLPALFSEEYAQSAPVGEQPEVKGNSDPAESGNWNTYVLDVKIAYDKAGVTLQEHTALLLTYGMGLSDEKAAQVMGLNRISVRYMLDKVVKRIVHRLNGIKPDPVTEDAPEPVTLESV